MDTFVHTTKKGRTEFGLTNTNKLIKSYKRYYRIKNRLDQHSKYCLSARLRRNNMDLIAVIMAAPDTKTRFMEAAKLLNYGFANYSVYVDDHKDITLEPVRVTKGISDYVYGKIKENSLIFALRGCLPIISEKKLYYDKVTAPLTTEDKIGDIVYYYNNEKIGSVDILAKDNIEKPDTKIISSNQ